MDILCRKCGSGRWVKNGVQSGIERCKCKDCGSTFRVSEPKHKAEMKLEALKMYTKFISIPGIAEIKKVHYCVVSYWIRSAGKMLKKLFYQKMESV